MIHMIIFLLLTLVCATSNADRPIGYAVQTKLGQVTGLALSATFDGSTILRWKEFRKIPFAKPPIGNLRFEKPVPYGKFKQENIDATEFGPSCHQMKLPKEVIALPNYNQSEDCLHLNIYTPNSASPSNQKSVMIWIHGGGYVTGQGTWYDGSYLSAVGDVIVVTVNYRLNIFGFLSTNDDILPGNYGLWDQKLAIEWVKDNIESFGGNPNSITIFGESAGGFSVMLQALHAGNKDNFKRVIAQSGTANSVLAVARPTSARRAAKSAAAALNCDTNLTAATVKCLKSKTAEELTNFFLDSTVIGGIPKFSIDETTMDIHIELVYAPVVDGDFLADSPSNILMKRDSAPFKFYQSLDVIIGNDEGEGSLILAMVDLFANKTNFSTKDGIALSFFCDHVVRPYVADNFGDNPGLAMTICNRYTTFGSLSDQGKKVVDFYGDVVMYISAVQSLNAHGVGNRQTKQYQYIYSHVPGISDTKSFPWFQQAGHGAELPYLFPPRSNRGAVKNNDKTFSKSLMLYWSNFAKTG